MPYFREKVLNIISCPISLQFNYEYCGRKSPVPLKLRYCVE
jgi:hypothetical protein